MSSEQILNELKQKRLPTFGTAMEKRDRLKKHYGFETSKSLGGGNTRESHPTQGSSQDIHSTGAPNMSKKGSCTDKIEQIKINRDDRRRRMEQMKNDRDQRVALNEAQGWKVDADFQALVEAQKENVPFMR